MSRCNHELLAEIAHARAKHDQLRQRLLWVVEAWEAEAKRKPERSPWGLCAQDVRIILEREERSR